MYIAAAFLICFFIVMLCVFLLRIFTDENKNAGFIVLPVNDDTDEKELLKTVKSIYYEESFNGAGASRPIIITGKNINGIRSVVDLSIRFDDIRLVELDELPQFLYKKEISNE